MPNGTQGVVNGSFVPAPPGAQTGATVPLSSSLGNGAATTGSYGGATGSAGITNGSYSMPDGTPAPTHNDVPTHVPAGPGYMTPAMQANQQQSINAGLVQSLAGLGARRDAAAKTVAAMPAQLNSIYKQVMANGEGSAGLNNSNGAAQSAVVQQAMADNAAQAKGDNAGSQMMTPLLQAGITADYSQGANTLNNTHMQDTAGVQSQQQAFDQSMLQGQAQFDATQAANAQSDKQQAATAANNLALQTAHDKVAYPNSALTVQQQQDATNQAALDTKATAVGLANNDQLQQITADPFYQAVAQAYVTGKNAALPNGQTVHGGDNTSLLKQAASSNYNIIRALQANGIISPSIRAAAGI